MSQRKNLRDKIAKSIEEEDLDKFRAYGRSQDIFRSNTSAVTPYIKSLFRRAVTGGDLREGEGDTVKSFLKRK